MITIKYIMFNSSIDNWSGEFTWIKLIGIFVPLLPILFVIIMMKLDYKQKRKLKEV